MAPVFVQVPPWLAAVPPWLLALFLIIVAGVIAYIYERLLMAVLRGLARRTRTRLDDAAIDATHPSLAIAIFAGFVWFGLRVAPTGFESGVVRVIDNASVTIVVIAIAIAGVRVTRAILHARAKQHPRWLGISLVGSRVISISAYTLAFLIILGQYGIEITPLLTALGVGALAVGLALQDTLANIFAGVWIQTQRSMRPGHYVKLEDIKLEGFVDDIGWRTTRVRTLPGNLVEIPNQTVARSTVTDYFLPDPRMGTSITVVTGFESDPEKVVPMLLEECMAAADEVSFILKDPPPAARLNRAVDNGWEYWMSIWVPFYYNQWNAQGYVLNKIRKRFLREGIRMPYPIRENLPVAPERADVLDAVTASRSGPAGGPKVPVTGAVAEVTSQDGADRKIRVTK